MNYVLDVAHAHLLDEEYLFIEELGDKIRHVHVSDNMGDSDQHLPIGDGNINWRKVVDALDDISYSGWIVIESYDKIERSIENLNNLL